MTVEKLMPVQAWREAGELFNAQERAALALAESVTNVAPAGVPDRDYDAAASIFSDKEMVDLTLAISLMNAYNRLSITFRNTRRTLICLLTCVLRQHYNNSARKKTKWNKKTGH